MRTLIKYISLLLFSGLIVPFYNHHTVNTKATLKSKQFIAAPAIPFKILPPGFLFIKDAVKSIFPVLKSLN
jgi:hypothetical protein